MAWILLLQALIVLPAATALRVVNATLSLQTVAIASQPLDANDKVTINSWAEVGHIRLEFDRQISLRRNASLPCPLSDPRCNHLSQGLFRLSMGHRVVESVGFLPHRDLGKHRPRLGALDVLVPFGCRYCSADSCEICDWAGTQDHTGVSSDALVENLVTQVERRLWSPDAKTISLVFLLSLNGKSPSTSSSSSSRSSSSSSSSSSYLSSSTSSDTTQTEPILHILRPESQLSSQQVHLVAADNPHLSFNSLSTVEVPLLLTDTPIPRRDSDHHRKASDSFYHGLRAEVDNNHNDGGDDDIGKRRIAMLEVGVKGGTQLEARDPATVSAMFSPIAGGVPSMIAPQVTEAVVPPIERLVFTGVADIVINVFQEGVVNSLWTATLNPVTDDVVTYVTKTVTENVGKYVFDNIEPLVTQNLTQLLTRTVTEKDYYCYYCSKFKEYCEYCQVAPSSFYYSMYYAGYYSSYYSMYFGQNGGQSVGKLHAGSGIKTVVNRAEDYLDELAYRTEKGRQYRSMDRAKYYANNDAMENYYLLNNSLPLKDTKRQVGAFFWNNTDTRLGYAY